MTLKINIELMLSLSFFLYLGCYLQLFYIVSFVSAYYNEETKTKITPVSSERSFDNDRERRSHHGQSQKGMISIFDT